jgi:hypothetical protein
MGTPDSQGQRTPWAYVHAAEHLLQLLDGDFGLHQAGEVAIGMVQSFGEHQHPAAGIAAIQGF